MSLIARSRSRLLLAAASFALFATAAAACGDGPDPPALPDQPADTAAFGPTPKPNPYVISYKPLSGAAIWAKDTVSLDSKKDPAAGPCFEADYTDLPANLRSFRIYIDRQDRTLDWQWTIPNSSVNPEAKPRACFVSRNGLLPGKHTVTVVIRRTEDLKEQPISQVEWSFEVR
jgi:hypothetical protein